MPPRVLNGTAANCGPPFGTKRPQVQILSPRSVFRRPEALPLLGWGLRFGPYRNGAHRGDSPGLRSASLVAVELVFAEISNVIDTSAWRKIRMITRGWTSRSKSSVAHVRLAS